MICIFRKQYLKNRKSSVKNQRHTEAGTWDEKLLFCIKIVPVLQVYEEKKGREKLNYLGNFDFICI